MAGGVISAVASSLCTTPLDCLNSRQVACAIAGAILAGAIGCMTGAGVGATEISTEIEVALMAMISTFLGIDVGLICDVFA